MYVCRVCGKQFEKRHAFLGHCSNHKRVENYKTGKRVYKKKGKSRKNKNGLYECKFCKKEFDVFQKLGGHVNNCELNPGYQSYKDKLIDNSKKNAIGRILTIETKEKISQARIKYLTEHPEKVPYRINHSSKESYPEKIFRQALMDSKIEGWVQEFQNGMYSYDFAFFELKIDIEIDGGTHNSEKVKKIDERRDAWSKEQGWKVIRFQAKEIKENLISCIEQIKKLIK